MDSRNGATYFDTGRTPLLSHAVDVDESTPEAQSVAPTQECDDDWITPNQTALECPPSSSGQRGFSTSEDHFDDAYAVKKASHYIADAYFGARRVHPVYEQKALRWHVLHLRTAPIFNLVLWAYVFLTFFERPLWCVQDDTPPDLDPCKDADYPKFNIPFLPRWADLLLEWTFLVLLVLELGIELAAYGKQLYANTVNRWLAVLLLLAVCDAACYAFAAPWSQIRLAAYLRIAILTVRHKEMHGQIRVIFRIMPAFGSISALFVLFVLIFAWCGCIVFTNTSMDTETKLFFPNLWEGMWTLMVLLTTNNSPDVMMPAYSNNRLFVLFYIGFMLLAYFFGLNMMTAVIYKEYNSNRELHTTEMLALRRENLAKAFCLLDSAGQGTLNSSQIKEVFWELNSSSELEHIGEDRARLLYAAIDSDGDHVVDEEEFMSICDVLQVRFVEIKSTKPLAVRFPRLHKKQWFRRFCDFINSQLFETIIDILLLLNAIVFAVESAEPLGWEQNSILIDIFSVNMEALFSVLFVLEVIAKVVVKSWGIYWRRFSNKFDFLVTVATVLATIYVYTPTPYNNPSLIRWFQILRILRTIRFLARVQGFKTICITFVKMLPPAARLLEILFVLMFVFSALGLHIFGGKINRDPDSKYASMLNKKAPHFVSPSQEYDFLAINFNDMFSGMVTLFVLLAVNNWDVIVEGFVAVTSPWLRIFFIIFHFFGVLLCLNIATSFIIDVALEYYSGNDVPHFRTDGGPDVVRNVAVFEGHTVTGTATGLTGKYKAIFPKRMTLARDTHEIMNRIFVGHRDRSGPSSSALESSE